LAVHLGNDVEAFNQALLIEPHWASAIASPLLIAMVFILTLTATRLPCRLAAVKPQIDAHRARLDKWAAFTPQNFLHMKLLVDAWHARNEGRHFDAERLFEAAIADARTNGFLNDEALGLRMAGEYFLERGMPRAASGYITEAYQAYLRWGAPACANAIREKHAQFFVLSPDLDSTIQSPRTSAPLSAVTTSSVSVNTTEGTLHEKLDITAILHATHALSGELILDSLIGRVLRLLAENAGAQHAVLSLLRNGELRIAAQLRLEPHRLETGLDEQVAGSTRLPGTLIEYVARANEPVMLGQATADSSFADDPYLRTNSPASVLAVPLLHQGRLLGIMYLEHTSAVDAFPKERIKLVSLLASQAATAVENARLYADLHAANIGLEAQVAERTAALDKALKDLWSEMDLAKKIQTVLLPEAPQIRGYELAAVMRPADQVGGDYYDVFRRGNQDWVLIGDVSGHGVPAGLCMMMIQSTLRAVALTLERSQAPLTPRRLLGLVNETIESNLRQIGRGQYVTITALCIEDGTVRYAGLHQDLLVYRAAQKKVERIETQGVWLGVLDGNIVEYLQDDELRLEAGDVLLLYTDGYTEAKLGERLLGTEELTERYSDLCARALPSPELVAGLLDSLKQAVVPDDVTLVALRRLEVTTE